MSSPVEDRIVDQMDVVELTRDAIIVSDPKGRIEFWNRGAESLYGWSKAEAIGNVTHELLRTSFPCAIEKIQHQLSEAGRWEGDLSQVAKTLDEVIVTSRWVVRAELARTRVIEINTGITAQRKIDEEMRRLILEPNGLVGEESSARLEKVEKAYRALVRRFRHDVTDHVGSIAGFLRLLRDGKYGELNAQQKLCIANMGLSVSSVLKIVEQMAYVTATAGTCGEPCAGDL